MNSVIADRWNEKVKPGDHVYHLGDVSMKMGQKAEHVDRLLARLHGHKRLVVGNHDDLKHPILQKHFRKITLWRGFSGPLGFTCSHIPLMISSLRDGVANVHGHIHEKVMDDPRYINVCVEQTEYRPIHFEEIVKIIRDRNL